MTAWTLLYHNRFPTMSDSRSLVTDAARATDGEQDVSDPPVAVLFSGGRGFGLGQGRHIDFRPRLSEEDVVGLDVTMTISALFLVSGFGGAGPDVTLFSAGREGVTVEIAGLGPPDAGGEVACRLILRTPAGMLGIEGLSLRQRGLDGRESFTTLRLRWTSKGQLQVWVDGALLAHENAIMPGARLRLDRLVIGDDTRPPDGIVRVGVTEFRLVQLRDLDAAGELGDMIAIAPVEEVGERCTVLARHDLARLSAHMRALMAAFNQGQTRSWRAGMAEPAFSDAALALHGSAQEAGRALPRYLRSGSDADRDAFVASLRDVLGRLAADQPALFAALLAESEAARENLPEECRAGAEALRDANADLVARLAPLTDAVAESLDQIRETL